MAFNPASITTSTLKALVDNLSRHLKAKPLPQSPKRSHIQEAVASTLGWPNWHAAITAAKAQELPILPTPTEPWGLPPSAYRHPDPLIEVGIRLGGSKPSPLDKVWRVDTKDMARHAMVWGSEDARRNLVERVACINPDRPMVVIGGPSSLPPRRWSGLVVEALPLTQAFAIATASDIVESLVSRMMSSGGDAQMWGNRAICLLSAVVQSLVWLRDNAGYVLDYRVIQEHLILQNMISLTRRRDLPSSMIQSLKAYLRSLPGYKEDAHRQEDVALEQHGYLQMQFTTMPDVASSRVLSRAQLLPSSDRATVELNGGVEATRQEHLICRELEQWVLNHPGGLMVFDGLAIESTLWGTIVLRLPHWQDAGVGAWVGVRIKADLPPSPLRDRLLARLGGALHLD